MGIYAKIADDITLSELFDFFNDNKHILQSIHIEQGGMISSKLYNRDMKEQSIKRMCDNNVANETGSN